jgi:hypothetical protein
VDKFIFSQGKIMGERVEQEARSFPPFVYAESQKVDEESA